MRMPGFITTERSRVGRRIVMSFLLFALLPLLIFAYQSHATVARELRQSADERLRRDVKSVGVTFLERLVMAAQLLRRVDEKRETDRVPVESLIDDTAVFAGFQDFEAGPDEALELGRTVDKLRVALYFADEDEDARIWLITRSPKSGHLRAARVSDDFLFRAEGLERPPSRFAIYGEQGQYLCSQGAQDPSLARLVLGELPKSARGSFNWTDANDDERLGAYWQVFASPQFGADFLVAVHDSKAEIMAPLNDYRQDFLRIVALTAAAVILASLVRIRKIMGPIQDLVEATGRIGRQEKGVRIEAGAADEFGVLAEAFNGMASTLERRAEVMEAVNEFGASLARESSPRALIKKLMRGAALMLEVDGVLVFVKNDQDRLSLDHLRIRSQDIEIESDRNGSCALYSLKSESLGSTPIYIDDLMCSSHSVAQVLRNFVATRVYELQDALIVPMLDHEREVIGALCIFNSTKENAAGRRLDDETKDLASSLAGQASVGIANARLRDEFKNLFDAMIEVLAVAVDEKSPYTGGHCRRVPKIALMLFDDVRAATSGPYARVNFSDDEAYEMQVASLLHDCGKVVTPVHVVDKATKLETIVDRIDAVSERLELALAQKEIASLRRRLQAGEGEEDATLKDLRSRLETDREFLRRANVGGEFMRDEDIERIEAISRAWSYVDATGEMREFLSEDEKLNLSIRKGTLNDEERRVINYHMDATIMMLDQLPFPRRLENVSLIAGSHHERMDGKGFPRGLDASTIPLQGRMLAIADVFEALTATDRPYKKGMPLTQALKIMSFMARDGHLDPELYAFFLECRIWERYALEILSEEQRDEVDLDSLFAIFRPETASV